MVSSSSNNIEEDYDSFPADDGPPAFMLDPESMAIVRDSGVGGRGRRNGGGSRASRSIATTQLATDVGSTIGPRKTPFLKSITFFDPKIYCRRKRKQDKAKVKDDTSAEEDQQIDDEISHSNIEDDDLSFEINDLTHWDIILKDPPTDDVRRQGKKGIFGKLGKVGDSFKKTKQPHLIIDNFEGLLEYSSIESGDMLMAINKKRIKPDEYSAEVAMEYMRQCLTNDGVLHITTENPQGLDTIINVTVIKPRPCMTYEELGLIVWNWPYLCVREVKSGSIFDHTAIQEMDQIAAINDIDCTKLREAGFKRCASELPTEITITLIRRKHRYTGSYN